MRIVRFGACFALLAMGSWAAELTGIISDSHCGAKHKEASTAAKNCVNSCIKGGASPVFVSTTENNKVYKIANPDKAKDFYGQKVTVSGDAKGDTLTIDTIEQAKS